jgi:hypothetical protein
MGMDEPEAAWFDVHEALAARWHVGPTPGLRSLQKLRKVD